MFIKKWRLVLVVSLFCNLSLFSTTSFGLDATKKTILPVQRWVSATGVPVYWMPITSLPLLDIRLLFDAGSSRDSKKPGLAHLTSRLVMTGTSSLSVDQIAERLDNTGASYGLSTDRDSTVLSVRTLTETKTLATVLNTLQDVLAHPTLPQTQFTRVKKDTLRRIKENQQYPFVVASQHFFKLLYQKTPYAYPIVGELDTVSKITRQDVRRFYKQFYCRKNAKLVLVGNSSREQAEAIANQLTKDLPEGQTAKPLPPVQANTTALEQKIPFPSTQSAILMGQIGINYHDHDYIPLVVGNHILGASPLVSRLFLDVRDKRGLVYSVGSYFMPLRAKGPFLISLQTRNSKANEAINQVHTTLDNFLQSGPTLQELDRAKKNIHGHFVVNYLTSNAAITSVILTLARYNLPLNYFDTYLTHIQSISRQEILSAFKRRVHPEHLVTVTVGQTTER